MTTSTTVVMIPGRELRPSDLKVINKSRVEEFGPESLPIDPRPDNEDWNKPYFLVEGDKKLLAFGRLHNVDVTFLGETYPILGIATMVALTKHQGYGKKLMTAMKTYIEQSGKTGLGFCDKDLVPFYVKCGLGVLPNGKNRFEPGPSRFLDHETIYVSGKDGLIEKMLKNPTEKAFLSRPQW